MNGLTVNFSSANLTVMLRNSNVASAPPTAVLVDVDVAVTDSASPTTVDSLDKDV